MITMGVRVPPCNPPRPAPPFGRRWYSSENVLERLESYQRDLEQELADVSDLLRRLKEEVPETQTA